MPDQESNSGDQTWTALSSMADGAASADEQARCMALWKERHDVRERWHQYQVIGDVLRSQELASDPARDAQFLRNLRSRLSAEPVPLRPAQVAPSRARPWTGPVAAVAGVVAVAGAMTVMLPSAPDAQPAVAVVLGNAASSAIQAAALPQTRSVNLQLIRDARLDRYFSAHRQSANGAALQMPGTVVRSVDTIVLENK